MLIVMVALVHLANAIIGTLPDVGGAPITLERVLGAVMAPAGSWAFPGSKPRPPEASWG
jgi:nucleoside permease NupC